MPRRKAPRPRLVGEIEVPGDKSISHRALILAALADGTSVVTGVNVGEDVVATATILSGLGATCTVDAATHKAKVEGHGWHGLREPANVLDAGNSGTTMRTLLGVCAGVPGLCVLTGDATLRRRPMLRVVAPLRQMGATIDGRRYGELPPLAVRGGDLAAIDVEIPVASAQVKTALLLAGLRAAGTTTVTEPGFSRDHTERMLAAAGVAVERTGERVAVAGGAELAVVDRRVPGDVSSAAFLLVAALLLPGSDLTVTGVGLNPTRTGALDVLERMGAGLERAVEGEDSGEPWGRVRATASALHAATIGEDDVPRLIDEIPVLAVAATQAEGETAIRGARELRVKESDRIAAMCDGLSSLGADVTALPDGLVIRGPTPLSGGEVDARGDHRIALAFAVAGLVASERVRVAGWSAVDTSFPEFLDVLGRVRT